jgi:hypothetical protein
MVRSKRESFIEPVLSATGLACNKIDKKVIISSLIIVLIVVYLVLFPFIGITNEDMKKTRKQALYYEGVNIYYLTGSTSNSCQEQGFKGVALNQLQKEC